jgi:hypothetical protein
MADGVDLMVRQGFHLGNVADSDISRVRVDGADGPAFHVADSPTLRRQEVGADGDGD